LLINIVMSKYQQINSSKKNVRKVLNLRKCRDFILEKRIFFDKKLHFLKKRRYLAAETERPFRSSI